MSGRLPKRSGQAKGRAKASNKPKARQPKEHEQGTAAVSALREDFNTTGGHLDPILARALREKEQDTSGPKPRTDVKRYGMRTIVNTKQPPAEQTGAAQRAERNLQKMLQRRKMQQVAAKTKLRSLWGWSNQVPQPKQEKAEKKTPTTSPTAAAQPRFFAVPTKTLNAPDV